MKNAEFMQNLSDTLAGGRNKALTVKQVSMNIMTLESKGSEEDSDNARDDSEYENLPRFNREVKCASAKCRNGKNDRPRNRSNGARRSATGCLEMNNFDIYDDVFDRNTASLNMTSSNNGRGGAAVKSAIDPLYANIDSIHNKAPKIHFNDDYDDATPAVRKRELRGFMDCSRLDRSNKTADSQESWTRYYVFLAEGMLSFFDKETAISYNNNNKDLPIETAFLKEAAILISKPAMNIITIHCSSGISYRLTHDDLGLIKTWFNFLKDTEIILKKKQRVLRNAPCISPKIKSELLTASLAGMSLSGSIQANKMKLLQFIKKRMTKIELKSMGIYKEPTFGGTLEAACALDGSLGPPTFLRQCLDEIEKRGILEVGIYRKSGSISQIQNVRLRIDEGNWTFSEVTDVHTLSGVVKLFFRELSSPLVPSYFCDSFLPVIGLGVVERVEILSSLIKELPVTYKNTLQHLLKHLKMVYDNEATNRMSLKNLALIFGPTLNFNQEGRINIGIRLTIQAQLIENMLDLQSRLF